MKNNKIKTPKEIIDEVKQKTGKDYSYYPVTYENDTTKDLFKKWVFKKFDEIDKRLKKLEDK